MRATDYTVGWVCALPLELTTAEAMLDETHPGLPQNPRDPHTYTLGRIGPHNVVIAALPAKEIGNNSANSVARHLRTSFPSVHVCLLVGIGGGVPTNQDVRLGDVVVSSPRGPYSGVVQYDLGRARANGSFDRRGVLGPPPRCLTPALTSVQSRHQAGHGRLKDFLPSSRRYANFRRENAGPDILFPVTYVHELKFEPCSARCDPKMRVNRRQRSPDGPRIHFGTIASGNAVVKNAILRDKLSDELGGILCFEMEAAALLPVTPCVVIRGVSDYADSHKNDSWQCYAAMCAAAFAKELLLAVPENSV